MVLGFDLVNTRAKGNKIQSKAIKELELTGWKVSKAEQGGRFNKEKDLFGLFDIVSIKKGACIFIQITCNRPHTHKKYQQFSKDYHNVGISFEQWVWYDRKGWVKFKYLLGNKIKTDKRK